MMHPPISKFIESPRPSYANILNSFLLQCNTFKTFCMTKYSSCAFQIVPAVMNISSHSLKWNSKSNGGTFLILMGYIKFHQYCISEKFDSTFFGLSNSHDNLFLSASACFAFIAAWIRGGSRSQLPSRPVRMSGHLRSFLRHGLHL